ncbi:MAG: hypothetical protein INR65_07650, partial [Gluconacetobacter diazotrophicus]|nr:hypothetical protein [Gluconacetobacter diazotrophicus]
VLFVGNSLTHAKYDPARRLANGYDAGRGAAGPHVHDLLCPSAAACSAAESEPPNDPDTFNYPAGITTLLQKLDYLSAHKDAQYHETGPFGGVPGIVLRLSEQARVPLDVSILAVSGSTLEGPNIGGNPRNAALIGDARWDHVVLQEFSTGPLPPTVVVNGHPVATTGDPAGFAAGVSGLVSRIDAADAAAGRAPIPVTLFQTQPLAALGFTSDDPAQPLYGSRSGPPGSPNAPYVGAPDPMGQVTSDLRNSYRAVAAGWNAANPNGSHLDVSPVGDGWLAAMRIGVARTDPFRPARYPGQVDLWDADAPKACCGLPVGYHPSAAGAYEDALVLFGTLSNREPLLMDPSGTIARALGIPAASAAGLRAAASVALHEPRNH